MQKIHPHLWFDDQAEEAVNLYVSLFKDSKIGRTTRYGKAGFDIHGQQEGKLMTVEFVLAGQDFMALNAGPMFKFTPAISFLIACESKAEVDAIWEKLSAGGKTLMELDAYPFSERYGWTQDRYGLSWQVMYMGDRPIRQKITPTLMFVGDVCGKADQAMEEYTAIFRGAKIDGVLRYAENEDPDKAGTVKHAEFTLLGQVFAAMDSARVHEFTFTEAISFMVQCETQEEIDYYWDRLTQGGDPAAQQCGWLKDRYGVSWQITPVILGEMMHDPDKQKVERVTEAFLKMKKFNIQELVRAREES